MKSPRWKIVLCALITFGAVYLLAPTLWSLTHPDADGKLPKWMPPTAMRLGLDLQGGVQLLMGVDLDKVVNDQLASYSRSIEKELSTEGLEGVTLKTIPARFELELVSKDKAQQQKLGDFLTKKYTVLEFVGETELVTVMRMARDQEAYVRDNALSQSIETIRNRIDEFGVAEPVITRKGTDQILIQFPGAKEPERLKGLIGQTAQLKFQMVHECVQTDGACLGRWQNDLSSWIKEAEEKGSYNREKFARFSEYRDRINADLKSRLPADTVVSFEREKDPNAVGVQVFRPWLLSTKNFVSGEYIEEAFVTMDQQQFGPQRPVVSFRMNAAGTPVFAKLTSDFKGHYMAIVLDDIVKSAPVIQSEIPNGQGQITLGTGGPDEMAKEARDTAIVLRAGALPASIQILEERVIGPSMGKDAIQAGLNSLIISSVVIFFFMWLYYGLAGLISNIATMVNIALIFAVLGALGATLTLPGIAGIVLTLGMAVDAIIIIYERMREEIRAGRNAKQVIALGFEHAFSTILDSNITTAIGAFVLLEYGTGSIRGFALTLIVGIVINVFMATFFNRTLLEFFLGDKAIKVGISDKELKEVNA